LGFSQAAPQQQLTILRMTSAGALDKTFGAPSGIVRLPVEAPGSSFGFGVAVQADGKVVVVGSRYNLAGLNEAGIVTRFNDNGTRDPTFNAGATIVVPHAPFVGKSVDTSRLPVAGKPAGSDGALRVRTATALVPKK